MLASPQTQAPPILRALRISYGIVASPSTQARAIRLTASVKALRPGVYQVGACIVSHWSGDDELGACTCQQARKDQRRACAHKLAVRLSEHTSASAARAYFAAAQVDEPEIIAIYARAKMPAYYPAAPKGFRVIEIQDGWATLENIATGTHASARAASLTHVYPFYE